MLGEVGVGEIDEQVYRVLLRNPTAPAGTLAQLTGLRPRRVGAALSRLEHLGLVRADSDGGWSPVNPDVAVSALIQHRQVELDALRSACVELSDEFRTGHLQANPARLIEVVTGREEVATRALDLLEEATREVMAVDQPPYAQPVLDELVTELPVLRRGVRMRIIYSQSALEMSGRFQVVNQLVEAGEQARTLADLPIKLRIYDHKAAIVPLTTDRHATRSVAVIHSSGLLDALIALFEAYWQRAHPIGVAAQEDAGGRLPLGEVERLVLGMLDSGLTDQTIARQLNASMRTVGRRIRTILDALDVTTRFQAGRQAQRRGWLQPQQTSAARPARWQAEESDAPAQPDQP